MKIIVLQAPKVHLLRMEQTFRLDELGVTLEALSP